MYRIALLGGFRVERDQQPIERFRSRKGEVLLAYLATFPKPHTREHLAQLLFPKTVRSKALLNLRVELHALKRTLADETIPLRSPLIITRRTVALDFSQVVVDVAQFLWLLEQAINLPETERIPLLEQACLLYEGEYLAGYEAFWIGNYRSMLEQRFQEALHQLCLLCLRYKHIHTLQCLLHKHWSCLPKDLKKKIEDFCLENKEQSTEIVHSYSNPYSLPMGLVTVAAARLSPAIDARAIRKAASQHGGTLVRTAERSVIALFSTPETALKWLMEIASSKGAGALLMGQWQSEPRRLLQFAQQLALQVPLGQIIATEPVVVWLRRTQQFTFELFGIYDNLNYSENIFLINGYIKNEGTYSSPFVKPSLSSLRPVGHIWGRESELAMLSDWLHHGASDQLLTITGPAGVGKTRLAQEFAWRVRQQGKYEVFFIPLSLSSRDSNLNRIILNNLNLDNINFIENIGTLMKNRSAILILDGADLYLQELREMLSSWFAQSPRLRCLVTSRLPLGIEGEEIIALTPLPTPPVAETEMERIAMYPSVRLFVEEAHRVCPYFTLTVHNASSVAAICRWAGGLPLALVLLAKRIAVYTPTQLYDKLSHGSFSDALEAAVGWSYHHLSAPLQKLLSGMSIFQGRWDIEATEAILEEPLAHEYLAQLLAAGLVTAEYDEQVTWFTVPAPVREIAKKYLTKDRESQIKERFIDYYYNLCKILSNEKEVFILKNKHVVSYSDQFIEAINAAIRSGKIVVGAEMIIRLVSLLEIIGAYGEVQHWYAELLSQLPNPALPAEVEIRLCSAVAYLMRRVGEYQIAWQLYEYAYQQADRLGLWECAAEVCSGLSALAIDDAQISEADRWIQQALSLCMQIADSPKLRGDLLHRLGYVHCARLQLQTAEQCWKQAAHLFEMAGDYRDLGLVLNNLGWIAMLQGQFEPAESLLQQSLQLSEEQHDKTYRLYSLLRLAELHLLHRNFSKSEQIFCNILDFCRQTNIIKVELKVLYRLAFLYLLDNKNKKFKEIMNKIENIMIKYSIRLENLEITHAWLALLRKDLHEAESLLIKLMEKFKNTDNIRAFPEIFAGLATLFHLQGQYALATSIAEAALALYHYGQLHIPFWIDHYLQKILKRKNLQRSDTQIRTPQNISEANELIKFVIDLIINE